MIRHLRMRTEPGGLTVRQGILSMAMALGLLPSLLTAANEVISLDLVNAELDEGQPGLVLMALSDGATINLNDLPTTSLNVRATVASPEGDTQSVVFALSGATTKSLTESAPPYALAGDSGGNYKPFNFTPGAHTLTATPYSGDGGGGSSGTALTVHFEVVGQASSLPVVAITGPASGTSQAAPADFTITATASDPDGSVVQVEFFQGDTRLGIDTTAPYSIVWNGVPEGAYTLTAVVTDNDSQTTTSSPVTVSAITPGSAGWISGELKKWHKVTITFDGPATSEDATPNPFMDYRLDVTFAGPGGQRYTVPGYYAADGNAANTGATAGNKWQAHFSPDEAGVWSYTASFRSGTDVAVDAAVVGTPLAFDGASGHFTIATSDKTGRDFRGKGRLQVVGGHYLRFADTGEYFLKQGPDAPENFLAYEEFDGSFKSDGYDDGRVKSWAAHEADWQTGDPTWAQRDGDTGGAYGKDIIGALNYLASEGLNAFSFLTFTIQGDDKNVFMYTDYTERYRFDVSRLAQWELLFEHADRMGLFLHFKTQETENDQLLDGGDLGPQRKLYYRELIARFGHHLALNWNLGEENDIGSELSDPDQTRVKAYAQFFHDHDPYRHLVVIHSYPNQANEVYGPLLGTTSKMTGASLQTSKADFTEVHGAVKKWVQQSAAAGKPWVVACDEPGDAQHALRPDNDAGTSQIDARKNALWGTLLAGGAGNEWYFGYKHAHSDLTCEDFRSRDQWWDVCRYALEFFSLAGVPFWQMVNENALTSADYCFHTPGEVYVLFDKTGGSADLDLTDYPGTFRVRWYDPRQGGALQIGSLATVTGGTDNVPLGSAPSDLPEDWVILVTAVPSQRIAYIHGDIAADGTIPSGEADAYQPMLLDDTGPEGLSAFKAMVEAEGYPIEQHYDLETTLDAGFLSALDVVIFGLHQKIWSAAELEALDTWLRSGGGMLIYSDSASGGAYNIAGAQNPVGQTVVNHLIRPFGMEVTVDQANGVKSAPAGAASTHPIVQGGLVLQGEGVSPVAVDPSGPAQRLIPYEGEPIPHQQNLTISNPSFAALAAARVGAGTVIVMFDRQPLWNAGPGSDITREDNREILRRTIRFLADRSIRFDDFMSAFPSLSGAEALPGADPDGDGIVNALEQWLVGDPTAPDSSGLALSWVDTGNFHYAFTYDSRVSGSRLIYQTSPDLVNWADESVLSEWLTPEGDLWHVDVIDPINLSKRFYRLKAVLD